MLSGPIHQMRIRVGVVSAVALLCGLAALVPITPARTAPTLQDKGVRVINTPAEAVPTVAQGTTTVAGTVGISGNANTVSLQSNLVRSQQEGPWTVGLSGTPTVQLARGTQVQAAGTPTRIFRTLLDNQNVANPANIASYTNQTTDLLVIELVSGFATSSPGGAHFSLSVQPAGAPLATPGYIFNGVAIRTGARPSMS
jgi:hypothetical protein